jgi:hypothetical protein
MWHRPRVIGEGAFPDGPESPPSPRAKALVEAGEWDAGEKLVLLLCSVRPSVLRTHIWIYFCATHNWIYFVCPMHSCAPYA